mgnify:CR=1 FL=1
MSLPTSTQDLEAGGSVQNTPLSTRLLPGIQGMTQGLPPPQQQQPRARSSVSFGQPESTTIEFDQPEHIRVETGFNTPSNPRRTPTQGYGLNPEYNDSESETPSPRMPGPAGFQPRYNQQSVTQPRRKVVIIKDSTLAYQDEDFKEFLDRFELAAEVYGAEGYDMVRQICRFVVGEELKQELESMDGYAERDWDTLRRSMKDSWEETYSRIKHTVQDLKDLASEYSRKGGIKNIQEYKVYFSKFNLIVKYLLQNEHIDSKKEVGFIFLAAFSKESQKNIKRELVKGDKISYAKDGYAKPPEFRYITEAAENEVRADSEDTFTFKSFAPSNRIAQKSFEEKRGPFGKRREKMIEENPTESLEGKVETLTKLVDTLTQKLNNPPPRNNQQNPGSLNDFNRGAGPPSRPVYNPKTVCFYCLREGHGTFKCEELQKDEKEGLVKREGKDYFLPNGEKIPWDPSRPIRHIVATESAKNKTQKVSSNYLESQSHPPISILKKTNNQVRSLDDVISSLHKIEWEPPCPGVESFVGKGNFRSNGVTSRTEDRRRNEARTLEPILEETEEDLGMDLDQLEVPKEKYPASTFETRGRPKPTFETGKPSETKKTEKNPETALAEELDNYKIPTTFGQLTKISPTYTEEILKKLMARIPKKTSVSISQGSLEVQKVKSGKILNKAKGLKIYSCSALPWGIWKLRFKGRTWNF